MNCERKRLPAKVARSIRVRQDGHREITAGLVVERVEDTGARKVQIQVLVDGVQRKKLPN